MKVLFLKLLLNPFIKREEGGMMDPFSTTKILEFLLSFSSTSSSTNSITFNFSVLSSNTFILAVQIPSVGSSDAVK